jgi:hypothetical protein
MLRSACDRSGLADVDRREVRRGDFPALEEASPADFAPVIMNLCANTLAAMLRQEIFNTMTQLTSYPNLSFDLAACLPTSRGGSQDVWQVNPWASSAHGIVVGIPVSALREVHNIMIINSLTCSSGLS